jgi:uncharacterized membrane protein
MTAPRFDRLDALRGLAMLWMTAFHFSFDLNHYGWIQQDFYRNPVWTWQRSCIVSLFLFCAGLSQAVAMVQGQQGARFWRRWRQVAGCALLVSLGSWFMFPQSWIYFGVLHGIAAMLLLMRGIGDRAGVLWPLGGVALVAPWFAPAVLGQGAVAAAFDGRLLNWLGFITTKPVTEDYVPLLPWLGVMCWGMASGLWVMHRRANWLSGPLPGVAAPLSLMGRWSLSYYMVHQPVLIGLLMLVAALRS